MMMGLCWFLFLSRTLLLWWCLSRLAATTMEVVDQCENLSGQVKPEVRNSAHQALTEKHRDTSVLHPETSLTARPRHGLFQQVSPARLWRSS